MSIKIFRFSQNRVKLKGNEVTDSTMSFDMPQTGRFECSDPLANRLWSNLTCGDWPPRRISATHAWTFRSAP